MYKNSRLLFLFRLVSSNNSLLFCPLLPSRRFIDSVELKHSFDLFNQSTPYRIASQFKLLERIVLFQRIHKLLAALVPDVVVEQAEEFQRRVVPNRF